MQMSSLVQLDPILFHKRRFSANFFRILLQNFYIEKHMRGFFRDKVIICT